jgi:hypothetical protein
LIDKTQPYQNGYLITQLSYEISASPKECKSFTDDKFYRKKQMVIGSIDLDFLKKHAPIKITKKDDKLITRDKTNNIISSRTFGRIEIEEIDKIHDVLNVDDQICALMGYDRGELDLLIIGETEPYEDGLLIKTYRNVIRPVDKYISIKQPSYYMKIKTQVGHIDDWFLQDMGELTITKSRPGFKIEHKKEM